MVDSQRVAGVDSDLLVLEEAEEAEEEWRKLRLSCSARQLIADECCCIIGCTERLNNGCGCTVRP